MSTVKVMYVGLKPEETDCVAGTGIKWVGVGDIKDVPVKAWATMQKHPDMWALVEGEDPTAPPKPATPALPATLTATDAIGRTAELALLDGVYLLPAGVVFADAPKPESTERPKYALQGPDGVIVLDGMTDAELSALADSLGVDIDLRKKGDKRRAEILDAVEAAAKG